MNVRSFAGDAEKSSLLDFVGGIGIQVPPTCGKLVIEKRDQFERLVPGATFEVTKNPVPGVTGAAADKLVVKDGAAPGIDTVADGRVTIDPAKPGTYTVKEIATPAGYAPDATVHTNVVVGSSGTSVATVEFTNKLYFDPLAVTNQASGSYGLEYDWRVHKTVVGDASKTVEEGQTTTFDYQVELEALPQGEPTDKKVTGTVRVTNPNPAATHPMMRATISIDGDLSCRFLPTNDDVDVDPGTAGVQVDVGAGVTPYAYACDPGAGELVSGDTTATVSWDQGTYPLAAAHPGTVSATTTYDITAQPKIDERASVTDAFDGGSATPIGEESYLWSDVWKAPDHRVVVATYSGPAVGGPPGACRDYENVARVNESDTDDFDTSEQTVEVCVKLKDLRVTKTAEPAFARDYDWTIKKSVKGDSSQTVDEGTKASFEYDVVVTPSISGDGEFVVTGEISVENPNETTISGVQLADSLPGGQCAIDKPAGTLSIASGESTFAYSCVLPDATAATTGTNTATATWDKAGYLGTSGSASGTAGFDFAAAKPSVTDATATVTDTQVDLDGTSPDGVVVKASDGPRTFTYSKEFEGVPGKCTTYDNTAKVVATDSKDADSDSESVEVCVELDDLVVTKSAKPAFARDHDWTIEKSVKGDSSQTVDEGAKASFEYDVVVTPSIGAESTFVVTGEITVTNPNETTLSGVQLADSLPGGQCTIDKPAGTLSIAKGTSTFDYSCVLPDATSDTTGTNTATATWDKTAYLGTSGSASGTAGFDFANAQPTVTDATATVTDTQVVLPGGTGDGVVVKAADGPRTFTYSKEFDGVPGKCTTYDNTAKVVATDSKDVDSDSETVEVCVDLDDLVVTKTAKPQFARDYDWTIEKSVKGDSSQTVPQGTPASFTYDVVVTPSAAQDTAFVVSGVITVDNPNETTISGVQLTDSLPGGQCTIDTPAGTLSIASGESTYGYSCVLPDATATTTGSNTATATWDKAAYVGTSGSASGTAGFDFANAKPTVTDATATVTDSQVQLGDVPGGAVVTASEGPRTFTYTKEFDGVPGECTTYDNTATVVATDSKDVDSDDASVEVCVEKPLQLPPTATADLTRDHAWSITKVSDATQRTVDANGNATFTYTVTARAGARTESGWRLQGEVAITNPNQYADGDIVADVTASTDLGGGAVCTVTGGDDVVVAADDSATLPIACTFTSRPAGSGTVSVTATWDPAGEATSTSVTESTEPVTFAVRSETNKTVQVVDDKTVAGQRVVLDPALTWEAGLVRSYTYSLTLAGGAAGACRSWTNTATIDQPVGTDPTASAAVLVCTPAVPPPPVVSPVAPPVPPEVLPEQAFGKAVGSVRASCQGTVRARLANRSGETVVYKLRVGKKVHKVAVKSLAKKRFVTKGQPRAKVTLKVGSTRLDTLRIPALCAAPEVLPDTGLRATSR
nr:prealbumin-like fold domain-containing protein [Nocardioides sp. zg-1230]